MDIKKIKNIATHDGRFHSDEIFAAAILKLINPKLKIIRTKDNAELAKSDIRLDAGRKYNPENGDFDHHQIEFTLKRSNGIPYASAGLVWKHFGRNLVNSEESFDWIDQKIIQPIDSHDNGIQFEFKGIEPFILQDVIDSFMPLWGSDNMNNIHEFDEALEFAIKFIRREVDYANSLNKASEIVKKLVTDKKYVVIEQPMLPWWELDLAKRGILFVVYRQGKDRWASKTVPTKAGTWNYAKLFPKSWADLTEDKLAKVSGVKDALFCHKLRFITTARSIEGAIKLTELALKERN
jgi:uncharacterized UPF0160 family protein